MRKIINIDCQLELGQVDIAEIDIDTKCRDEIPQLLIGIQYIYKNVELRSEIFRILKKEVPEKNTNNGRPGMDLWQILVLALLRLNTNWDWDKIHFMVNTHKIIRQFMGIGDLDAKKFSLQTIKDNVSLLKPKTINKISNLTVNEAHKVHGNEKNKLNGKCDSVVVETDVHFPTDINLLLDAIRKVIFLMAALCSELGITGWRKYRYKFNQVKSLYRKCQKMKRSTSKNNKKKKKRDKLIKDAFETYLEIVETFLQQARNTISEIDPSHIGIIAKIEEIERFMKHAERQINQIRKRVIKGETIPHNEKVFSIFEEYTEWISKGKAGVPVELGLRICVLEDQYGYILHYRVMQDEVDSEIAVPLVKASTDNFPMLKRVSFDKGFWSKENKSKLDAILEQAVLPKRGRHSKADKSRENSEEFKYFRNKHSAVESGINALENHGLDRCPDRGLNGFKRYISLAILARNVQILGATLRKEKLKKLKKNNSQGKMKKAG